jgi:uncharacterized membrane protein YfcA
MTVTVLFVLAACALCGLASGFMAGLLGIGGGLIVVPALMLLLPHVLDSTSGVPQVAVATSLAAMIPTTVTALAAQWRRGAVDIGWLARMAPGACIGAVAGALLLPWLDARLVAAAFVVYASWFSARLLLTARGRSLPMPWNRWPATPVGAGIGLVSVLAGVGGAVFTVPYLEGSARLPMTHAVGTSSGVALSLSLVAVGWLAAGAHGASLLWWPGALAIGSTAMCTASLGVRQAHRWPAARLKRSFAWLLVFAAAASMWKLVHA